MVERRVFRVGGEGSTGPAGVGKAGLAFVSALSADPEREGDIVEQTWEVYKKLGELLREMGLGPESVVKTVDYIVPAALTSYRETAEVRREFFKGNYPAATGIVVERLLHPKALIAVDAVAVWGERARPINPGWSRYDRLTFSPAVMAGKYLWVSGLTGRNLGPGPPAYAADVVSQAETVYAHIGAVLKVAGATPADVIKTVDYISPGGLVNYRGTRSVREEFFKGDYPASTGIVVTRLLHPEAMLEVEALAVVGGERQDIIIPGWEAHYGRVTYRAGVRKDRLVAVAGQGAIDPTTNKVVAEGDAVAQAEFAYRLVARVLEAVGGGLRDVVKVVEFLAPGALARYQEIAARREELFAGELPALTTVVANRLLRPEMLIEVDVLAVLA